MEPQSPLGLEVTEPIYNSNQATSSNSMNYYNNDFNQSQTNNFTKIFPFKLLYALLFVIIGIFAYLTISWECGILAFILGFCYVLVFVLLSIYFLIFKMEINKYNSIINVNFKNIFGCDKITFSGNIHFYFGMQKTRKYIEPYFFIINDSKYDLNSESIRIKPAKLFYPLNGSINEEQYFEIKKRFEVYDFENPLLFDIIKSMGKNRESSEDKYKLIISKLMKFGEHFYTLYITSPLENNALDNNISLIIIFIFSIPFFALGFFNTFNQENNDHLLLGIISLLCLLIFPIIIYLLCLTCDRCCTGEKRLDFIFSKDFDRIFIGAVNDTQERYNKTFEYQIDEIERFFFQQSESKKYYSNFKVALKNQRIDDIQEFRCMDQYDQEGLEYILNGKLNTSYSSTT